MTRAVPVIIPVVYTFRLREPGRMNESDPVADPSDPFEHAFNAKAEGLTLPRRLSGSVPPYTPEALRAGIQGTVVIEGIIDVGGRVSATRVLTPLIPDYGLNAQSENAVRGWGFEPPRLNGKAVPVVVPFTMTFNRFN